MPPRHGDCAFRATKVPLLGDAAVRVDGAAADEPIGPRLGDVAVRVDGAAADEPKLRQLFDFPITVRGPADADLVRDLTRVSVCPRVEGAAQLEC